MSAHVPFSLNCFHFTCWCPVGGSLSKNNILICIGVLSSQKLIAWRRRVQNWEIGLRLDCSVHVCNVWMVAVNFCSTVFSVVVLIFCSNRIYLFPRYLDRLLHLCMCLLCLFSACSSLSGVDPPNIWYKIQLPTEVIDEGRLSALQLEALAYASQQHWTPMEDQKTYSGFLIGWFCFNYHHYHRNIPCTIGSTSGPCPLLQQFVEFLWVH